jgi:predicted anti-sigma-YlaC factor YlaD
MDCSSVHHNLLAYSEDNVTPEIKRDIETHLSECGPCRHLFAGMESVDQIFERARAVEPNPFIATRIIRYVENNLENKVEKRGLVFRPILVTLAILGAIALGYTIGKSGFDRMNGAVENKSQIENLKLELYIHDFIEEDNNLLINE